MEYLDRLIALSELELERTRSDAALNGLADMYRSRFVRFRSKFVSDYGSNVIEGFRQAMEAGGLELITCSATHAFLPYVQTEQAIRAQLENAVREYIRHFGKPPRGIWLPECGYREGLDRLLLEYGFEYFFTDTHAVLHARPAPDCGVHAPVMTTHGAQAFGRDPDTSRQVWSSLEGYPGDYDYREYYRDVGFELPYDEIRPYLHPSGVRHNTGFKYWRITGREEKERYDVQRAAAKAAAHADHFVAERIRQAERLAACGLSRKPLMTASYDAELFGHWWHEGPQWIDALCRKAHAEPDGIRLLAPPDYLREYPESSCAELAFSSWGRGGYGEVWLGEPNAWMYRHLHLMEERMAELAGRFPEADGLRLRALNQAVRELLLAQSSDWAFIMDSRTTVEYAVRRFKRHAVRFERLYRA
ncbi:glycoside hydrolase family 57 protein [Gordoniibacillus kamchatkensis]|uniref:glycoside hydrolase family 57 protein n=1 Tax=Gordoniibacillus kamchatkensis TaxID=1590651 RepID=UPI0018CFE5FE|nr:1,4-alpha-glucan branching protein domain-containing protein [Paenibacillus sp. VKM B-2647]